MIRVCHVITGLGMGGAEVSLYRLVTGLNSNKFESHVISLIEPGIIGKHLKEKGIHVHSLRLTKGQISPLALLQLRQLVKRLHPNLVQGWMYHGNLAASLSTFLISNIPVFWGIRNAGNQVGRVSRKSHYLIRISSFLSSRVRAVIYNSRISSVTHEQFGYDSSKTMIIPNGFDTQMLVPSHEKKNLRASLTIPFQDIVVGHVARYHPMKDHSTIIKAAGIVIRSCPGVKFVLVGSGVNWDNQELERMIDEQGLRNNVILLGERGDIAELNAAFDIACSSSWTESFPNAIGEAMACAVPCVATDVGESASLIGETGKVVPASNPIAFAEAILNLINMGPQKREELGRAARERIIKEYSIEKNIAEHENLYQSIHP